VENQKQVSHFPIPPRDDELGFLSPERSGLRPPRQPLRGEPNTIAESRQQVKTKWKGAFPRPPAPHVSRIILYWKRKPISGSSFDWNMLDAGSRNAWEIALQMSVSHTVSKASGLLLTSQKRILEPGGTDLGFQGLRHPSF
jgi:hypothetical protein